MNNTILDFFIGLTLVNVLPHYLVGILNIRFLGLYGFGNNRNIAYAWTSFLVSIILFHINYGIGSILDHSWYLGGICVILSYLLLGRFLVRTFKKK
jgi:hypothetical protein